jgi:ABC-type transport system involved in multi-copper enzyme maturation permease subunit
MTSPGRVYPALEPGVWRLLLRNEWFKARRRVAFLVTLALFAFINLMDHGGDYLRARRDPEFTYALPGAWQGIFSDDSIILLIFASIAVIMLISSEFSWRTARQNVIDGLSKEQWYWGKVLLVVLVGVVFVVTKLLIGGGMAALGTDLGTVGGAAFPLSVVTASLGLFLAYLSVAGLALLVSVMIRSSGPAMAVWFFWITLGEQLLPSLVTRVLPATQPAFGYLPFSAAQKLLAFWVFDAGVYGDLVARAQEAEQAVPELPNALLWMGVNAGWAVVFVAVGYGLFRRRDL